ncbi:paralemmin-2-like [Sander lucioperca]|uniref:paralemmin-2-like n=1 Tax=Sander lucioperca TaxID=283035 RepID=UPI0016536B37|nr:paralemmin-2-like [Sander lucioperca]
MSPYWVRPQDFIHITGHILSGQATGGKKPLACRIQAWHASTPMSPQCVSGNTESQRTPEDEEVADAREKAHASQEESKESVNSTQHSLHQAGNDEDVQVNKAAETHFPVQMAQRMSYESGQEGRSVLGMLAVQVERDPKTGATSVRSVAPVSVPTGAPMAATVYDDGRKSIRAVGGSGSQPSSEELGQILSIVDGVGMKALLDEVTVTPNGDRHPEGNVSSFSTGHATAKEDRSQLDSSGSYDLEDGLGIQDCAVDDRSMTTVRDVAGEVDNMEGLSLDEGPVTLVFLGYTDGDGEDGRDDNEGMLTAERVIITDEGEEHVVGPETSPETGRKESQEFQDVPLDGNGARVKVPGGEGDSSANKRKTCQCCSVM